MSEVLFIPSAKVTDGRPEPWFQQRLDTAYSHCLARPEDIGAIVISGRWSDNVTEIARTEAAVARDYLLSLGADLNVLTEEQAVETGGNFAFSAPIIAGLRPDKVTTFNSAVYGERMAYFARKIFGPGWLTRHILVDDSFSQNPRAWEKENHAIVMFQRLFDGIDDGNYMAARDILLNHTPFYDRTKVDNEAFFNEFWPGGFAHFLSMRPAIDQK